MKTQKSINTIICNQLLGDISEEDRKQLELWLKSSSENKENYERLMSRTDLLNRYQQFVGIDEEQAWATFQEKHIKVQRFSWTKVIRSAAIFILPVVGVAFWLLRGDDASSIPVLSHESQVAMIRSERLGKQKATLVLPDGQKVTLSSSLVQSVQNPIAQPLHAVSDLKDSRAEEAVTDNNKLITNNDSEFWLTFEDGTKVHLNYNTALKYPSHFSATNRIVYLEGEAYFQIAKDNKRPFLVVTADGIIQQYGTSFNVNTHAGSTKVVLVEGSVSILTNRGGEYKMKPGELGVFQSTKNEAQISQVDIEPYVAWNKGRFIFDNCSLEDLMNVISGWYGKEVIFESEELKTMCFTGDVDRYESIIPVVKAIQRVTGLQVEITEKNIILSNRNNNH